MIDKSELRKMSRKELEKLSSDVQKALTSAKAKDHREAKKAASKAAAEFGFSLGEIAEPASLPPGKAKKKAKTAEKPSKPAFANPANNAQTWTGKGRQPNWYRDQIAAGTAPEAMRIANQ